MKYLTAFLLNKGYLFFVVMISIFLFTSVGEAATSTFYVAKTGSNQNTCSNARSESGAKKTINAGASCLSSGDTLLIKSGTYVEGLENVIPGGTSWNNPTTVAAFPNDVVTIKGPVGAFRVIHVCNDTSQYIVFDGLIIDAIDTGQNIGLPGGKGGEGFKFSTCSAGTLPHHIRVQNTEIKDAPHSAFLVGGDFHEFLNLNMHNNAWSDVSGDHKWGYSMYITGNYNLIDGVVAKDTGGYGLVIYNHATGNAHDNIIRNSTIISSGFVQAERGAGIQVGNGTGNQIYNNVIYGGAGGAAIIIYKPAKVINNIVYDNVGDGIVFAYGGDGSEARSNIFWGITGARWNIPPAIESNNITINPNFVNASIGDFHLQSDSPAINAGIDLSSLFEVDFDGNNRTDYPGFDIGAFEFIGEPEDNLPPAPPVGLMIIN